MKLKFKKLISAVVLLSVSKFSMGAEDINTCVLDAKDRELINSVNNTYLEFSSLYTGGMHFKHLGSADGSLTIYLALNNRFETIGKINAEKLVGSDEASNEIDLYDTSVYLRRLTVTDWGYEKPYDISSTQVLKSALKVAFEVVPAYKHINELKLPYSFHYRQAGYDLDVFTGVAEPVDWWLLSNLPTDFNGVRATVWSVSKENDFIDWLQFVATTSALPHLQNWNFTDLPHRKEGYSNLKKHAVKKWSESKSYAWLAALAEVVDRNDNESGLVLNEFEKLSKKILACDATKVEQVAYGMILTNALRLGYGKDHDINSWLTPPKDDHYKVIRSEAGNRLSQYVLAIESLESYQTFWNGMGRDVISAYPQVVAFTANEKENFIFSVGAEPRKLSDVELRFSSILSVDSLINVAEQPNLSSDSKKKLIGTAFLRSWVNNDIGDEVLLNKLALVEPSLKAFISEIVIEKSTDIRKAMLLKLVMESPGLTYLLGVELYWASYSEPIGEFVQYNSEDGNWWCETEAHNIVNKYISSTVRPFGLIGSNPQTSGGNWGVDFYNPGQKRAYLRSENIITDNALNEGISKKLKENHKLLNYSGSEEWIRFSKLPPAPIFFANKVYELENSKDVSDASMIDLYKLLIRSAKKTCRKHGGVYQTLKDARSKLKLHHGVTFN